MSDILQQLVVNNLPTIVVIALWAHKIDKRISIMEFHLFGTPKKSG